MARYDTIIKSGTIVDGMRTPRYTGDIGIVNGRIAEIGNINESEAKRVIDARDQIVCPGFIDIHTHYDSQLFWDPYCTISGWHGVTSIVIGNCGFGFAPCKPEDRERSMLTMERNEAIRATTMAAGMPWDWESFPEYLDSVERAPKGVNVLSYVPLAPLMSYVMGLEGAKGRSATPEEMAEMCRTMKESLDAGACGFSAQLLGEESVQRDYDGTPMITDTMSKDDLFSFAGVLRKEGRGLIQLLGGDLEFFEKIAEVSGRPVIFGAVELSQDWHGNTYGYYKDVLRKTQEANARGNRLFGHALTCRNTVIMDLAEWNLFDDEPAWRAVTLGTIQERIQKMRDPELRQAIKDICDWNTRTVTGGITTTIPDMKLVEGHCPETKALEGFTIGEICQRENKHPIDVFLDLSIMDNLHTTFQSLPEDVMMDDMRALANGDFMLPGMSDGGAHMKFLTSGRYPTEFLSLFVRDNDIMSLEDAHWRLSGYSAMAAGFTDRGYLREGAPADILVYDYDNLKCLPLERLDDFPAGDWRVSQKAEGYSITMVNGEVTFEKGECTGATPGALLRHGRADA